MAFIFLWPARISFLILLWGPNGAPIFYLLVDFVLSDGLFLQRGTRIAKHSVGLMEHNFFLRHLAAEAEHGNTCMPTCHNRPWVPQGSLVLLRYKTLQQNDSIISTTRMRSTMFATATHSTKHSFRNTKCDI